MWLCRKLRGYRASRDPGPSMDYPEHPVPPFRMPDILTLLPQFVKDTSSLPTCALGQLQHLQPCLTVTRQ